MSRYFYSVQVVFCRNFKIKATIITKENSYITRLAPSPTGALHLGNARTFLITWLRAESQSGKVLMRMEDLDHPRVKVEKIEQAYEDLRWLGLNWGGAEVVQSQHYELYCAEFERLQHLGLVYPCTCSRADIEAAQSAPHAGEDLVYPNTCRGMYKSFEQALGSCNKEFIAWRFNTAGLEKVEYIDNFAGRQSADLAVGSGDFVVAKMGRDGVLKAAYQLACVIDDNNMGVSEVIRADDLINSTFRQIELYKALGYSLPEFFHLPLVVGMDGRRLAKRHGDTRISCLREKGVPAEKVLGWLGWSCGLCDWGESVKVGELVELFRLEAIPAEPLVIRMKDLDYLGF